MLFFAVIFIVICLADMCNGRILLYDTENMMSSSEKYDCIYVLDNVVSDYGGSSAGKIPYCQRSNSMDDLREIINNKCENDGEIKYLINLLEEDIQPSVVLKWSSSVELADEYAAMYYSNYTGIKSSEKQDFLCFCTNPSTFGKYCEYLLTHEANSFEECQSSQTIDRRNYRLGHQEFGAIVCYETLSCDFGLLCLDWRDICDGEQQCENGLDEENCDKLEFNECEEDEFRCDNGMCVPEEYWLDGDKDCMDWSDENFQDTLGNWCFEQMTTIDCDEHICLNNGWSCGDGQCISGKERLIFHNTERNRIGCWNLRNMNHMCELSTARRAWTLPNGLCWLLQHQYDDPWLSMDNAVLSNDTKCTYLLRCALSDGLELDCPCKHFNCTNIMATVCEKGEMYAYPLGPVIRPYFMTLYLWDRDFKDQIPDAFVLVNSIRCRGYHGLFTSSPIDIRSLTFTLSFFDSEFCLVRTVIRNSTSSIKYDNDCWKDSLTFNGRPYAIYDACKRSNQCISQYRINDGRKDCKNNDDENIFLGNKDLCTRVRRHRFQCSIEPPTCMPMYYLGDGRIDCSNNYDEYLYGYGRSLSEITCQKIDLDNCELLKKYIKDSTLISNLDTNSHLQNLHVEYQFKNRIPFRSYCDTFWNLQKHIDELSEYCQNWICHQDQYRCQTGQCIPLNWVCDGQWDCNDASDEEGLLAINQWSLHNQQLKDLNKKQTECFQRYSNLSFSQFCNITNEFPCLRSNVSELLNLSKNRPCIPYSKIGDRIEDCYNAYDEKNTFTFRDGTMWGFALQCGNSSLNYPYACQYATSECAQILCPYRYYPFANCSKHTDAICIDNGRCVLNGRCNGKRDCLYGEDEYWCAPNIFNEQVIHRYGKFHIKDNHIIFDKRKYPLVQSTIETRMMILSQSLKNLKNSNQSYSFMCNKGVTVIKLNKTVCFCPPAYFGDKCQFFSDRITIITHLDLTTWPSLLSKTNPILKNMTIPTSFKINVNFLFYELIIDHYEFYSNTAIEKYKYVKHKFYLLYSRSIEMLSHKKTRFPNRTDIENNHPYSVHFDIYALYSNESIPITLGSWHYPIYFDFLPSFRLATVLRFPYWLGNFSHDPCTNHTCNQNSICQPIFNQNNSYICSCKNGFYGENCSNYDDICKSYCSPYSFCRPDNRNLITNTTNPFCICPLGHFGPRCFLRFEQCDNNSCLNNGSCVYNYESYGTNAFSCICSKFFYGDRCQHPKVSIHVRLNPSTTVGSPRASTIQLYDVDNNTLQLILRYQQVSSGLPSSISYVHDRIIAPVLGILKTHSDSIQPKYFIIYLRPNTSTINISSSPEHCPLASSLLEKYDFLNIPDVFKYHHICQNNSQRLCFYDKDYLCICQGDNYRVDCFMHDTQIDRCSKCMSNGKCFKGDIHDDKEFICLCPRCYHGRLCEFNMQAFGFTLDSLLVDCSKEMKIVYLSMFFILFIFGLFNNLCSFVTFKRPTPRKFGVGNYLFIITCLNEMSLFCLLIKFIQINFEITNIRSCKIISYFFSVFTRSTYWLTSWVTIDRFFIVFFPTSITLKKPSLAIGISIVSLFCLFAMHIHEIIYYTTISHLSTNSLICVTNFDNHLISTYNRVSTLIHYLLPFCIQIIAITVLIVLAARSRTKATNGTITFRQILIKQFHTQKELYITPIIIILSALPQTILTFSLACTELTIWHRHTLIITYLFSYAPQVLGFILYVLPSTSYKKEFSETSLAKTSLNWILNEKKSTITVTKTK